MNDDTEATQGLPEGEAVVETPEIEQAPETGTEQETETPEEEAPKPKGKPWFQERIDQLTREKYDERRRAEAAEAFAEKLSKGETEQAPPPADFRTAVQQEAAKLANEQAFNAKCDTIYSSGEGEYGREWNTTLANFGMLGGLNQPFLEAVTELPDAHKVLHALGTDMDAAARIMSLPPIKMAMELAKLSQKPARTKPVSNAPPPISPLDGRGTVGFDPETADTGAWLKWREDQVKARS